MTELSANQYICPEGYGVLRFLDEAAALGYRRVGLHRGALAEMPARELRRALRARDLALTSLNSAGYFTWADPARRREQDAVNRALIDAAAELEAGALCVITGGATEQPDIAAARARIAEGLAGLDARAAAAGVALGLEPIHPLGVPDKGCINTIAQALALIAPLGATGLIVDLYHSWWDPDLEAAMANPAARVRLVQICNVRVGDGQPPRRSPWLEQGALQMAPALGVLRRAGYADAFEFEVFAADHGLDDVRPLLSAAADWSRALP